MTSNPQNSAGAAMDGLPALLSERVDGILYLSINRPRAANAINHAVAQGLAAGLAQAGEDDGVRAVILTGTGEKIFCAGRDLKNPQNLSPEALNQLRRAESIAYTEALMGFDKPLVLALNGAAIGAGLMLALHADQVIAVEHATLSLPEINIGIPTFLGHALIAEWTGNAIANDLMLTGRRMPASEALDRGLVHAVVRADALMTEARARADALGAKPRETFRAAKGWILQRRRLAVRAAYATHAALEAGPHPA